jgi:hypothetical protein
MRMIVRFIAVLAAVAAFTLPQTATAQDGPVGIGFAQAEEGTWWCRGDNATTALDCARAECVAGAGGQDCYRVAWCYPARWSGLMTVWLGEFHSTEIVCGAPSLAALEHALEAFCTGNPYAISCDVFLIIDPDGAEAEAATTFTGGGAAAP